MPARVDANQPEIVRELRDYGCTVQHLHAVGKGCPDILVGYRGVNYLMEIKDPAKRPSQRKLTSAQRDFFNDWAGQADVILDVNDAIRVLNRV